MGRGDQHHLAVFVREAEDEDLGDELADLARREIDDACDLPADQRIRLVVAGNLRRAALSPMVRPKSIQSFNAGLRASG